MTGRQLQNAMTQADVARTLTGCAEKDLGRRRVRVLLQKVMLDFRGVVVSKAICELELGKRVLIELPLTVRPPRARQLQLVEDSEVHAIPRGGTADGST